MERHGLRKACDPGTPLPVIRRPIKAGDEITAKREILSKGGRGRGRNEDTGVSPLGDGHQAGGLQIRKKEPRGIFQGTAGCRTQSGSQHGQHDGDNPNYDQQLDQGKAAAMG